jgi:hypothetical protein
MGELFMSKILEKALVHLLNEDHDKAAELMHQFVIAKAREIHESLRNGEEAVLEGFDDDITEQYFTEADLEDAEDAPEGDSDFDMDHEAAADDLDADMGADDDTAAGDSDFGDEVAADVDADVDADVSADTDPDLGDLADEVADLKDMLTKLTAELESKMDLGGDQDMEEPADADADFGGDVDGDVDPSQFGEEDDGDFDDITESVLDELEKITVPNTDGREVGNKSFQQNTASLPSARTARPKPVVTKQAQNDSFERETPPSSKSVKSYKNNKAKSTDGQSKVSKEGDKSAELNKVKPNDAAQSPFSGLSKKK